MNACGEHHVPNITSVCALCRSHSIAQRWALAAMARAALQRGGSYWHGTASALLEQAASGTGARSN